ncbi:MAG: cyclic nucleotide-binding domain-containing protein [Myxococcota bacterium]|nr:cyclic nucleotide-binding domain-containing protein [Myxococcota bacterium]
MCTHKSILERLHTGDYFGALCEAGPMLAANTSDLTAWYHTARALYGLGEAENAMKNLRGVALAVAEDRRPVLALSLLKEIEDLGGETDDLVAGFAKMYSAGSERLTEAEMAPPPLPSLVPVSSWDPSQGRDALVDKAQAAMAVAWADSIAFINKEGPLPFIPLISSLSAEEVVMFIDTFWRQVFEPGEVIIEQDTPGDGFYLIAEGHVRVMRHSMDSDASNELAKLGPGAFLGEMSIVARAPRAAAVIAAERTVVLFVERAKMEALASRNPEIGNVLVAFCHARMLENLMRTSPVLSPVPVASRPDVIALFDTDYYKAKRVIIREGDPSKGLFLVVSGSAGVVKEDAGEKIVLARLGPGDVFGEMSLLMQRPSTATVIAEEDTAVLVLSTDAFHEATQMYPELLKGAFDIAVEREEKNRSILASPAAAVDDLVLM